MTEISLHEENKVATLKINGHAEYSDDGADIVCASCSTLSGTLATMLANLPINAKIRFESGLTEIRINYTSLGIHAVEVINAIKFVMMGFHLLEEQYPDNVIVIEGRESQLFM
ncbi:uncharacterized protein YsxB (DUF464 family) [Clostridiales Family XIII bacterium PM5-7]